MKNRNDFVKWMICGIITCCILTSQLRAQTVSITPDGPTSFCRGGSVTLCASGASGYVWSNDSTSSCITVNKSGTYAVAGTAANGSVSTAFITVSVSQCGISLVKTPDVSSINAGSSTPVNFTYSVINTGSSFNASGIVKDDNGTPGNTADDLVICNYNSVAPGATNTCTHSFTLNATHTNIAIASGSIGSVAVGDTTSATVTAVSCGCSLAYPDNSNLPKSGVAFNESSVLQAFEPGPATCGTTGDVIKLWYSDEHALTLGVRRVIVKTASGITTTDYPVTATPATPSTVNNPIVGDTIQSGDQSANDVAAGGGRPLWPSLFITDLTVSGSGSRIGDWQQGGIGIPPHKICGTWKAAVRTVDLTHSPAVVSVTPDVDPVKNHWVLGTGSDVPAGGFASLNDDGYGAECAWNINDLGLIPGHTYRLQFIVHDGDQNSSGGDCGEACTSAYIPPCTLAANSILSDFNGSNVSCNGAANGFAHLIITGGHAPYSYSWSVPNSTANLDNISAGTYRYTVTDANGCQVSDSVVLKASNQLSSTPTVSNYNGSNVRCNGSSDGFIHLAVNGGTVPYSYSWSVPNRITKNLDQISAGTYNYTVTDANGCTTSNTVNLIAPNPLTAPSALSNYNGSNVSCSGSTNGFINLTVSGGTGPYTYSWTPGGSTSQNLSNIGAGTYSYVVTDANGCNTSNSVTLLAPNPLNAPTTLSNYHGSNVSCSGSTNGFINLSVSGGTGPYTYAWLPGGSTSQNLTNIGAGTYSYTVTDANNCVTSSSVTLTAPNPLTAPAVLSNFNGSNVSCAGSTNGFINLTTTGGTSPYTYAWLPGGSTSQNLNNIGAGTYSYTVTDANNCIASNSVTLNAPSPLSSPAVVSDFHGSNVSCAGSTNGFIHLTTTGGTSPYTYAWLPGGSTSQNLNNIGAGTYAYTVTDLNGCSTSNSVTLNAPNPLSAPSVVSNYHGSNVSCIGSTNGFINLTVTGGTGPYSYAWLPGGSTSQNLTNIGAGTYRYRVTDLNGCTTSDSVTLTAPNPLTSPSTVSNYHGSNVSCNGSTNGFINLTVSGGTAPYSYAWSPGGSTTQNLTNIGAGTYSYTVTDANGCTSSSTVMLIAPNPVNAPSTVSDYHGSNVSCSGSTNGFIHVTANGGTAPYTYFWSPGGSTSANLNNIGAGTYSYTVTDANGCLASSTVTLDAPDPLTAPTVLSDYNGSNISCSGATDGFIHLTVAGGTGPYTYHWMPGGSTSQNLNNLGAGTYSFVVTDANGCTVGDSITLTTNNTINTPAAVSDYNGSSVSCSGSTNGYIHLTVSGGTAPYTYVWSSGGSTTQNLDNIGAGTYSYTVTDVNGCHVTNTVTLTAPNPVDAPATVSDYHGSNVSCNTSTNGYINLTVTGGTAPYTYLWLPGGSTSQNLTNIGAGTYSYTVTDANGCINANAVTLTQPDPLTSPFVVSDYNGSSVSCHGSTNGYIHLTVSGGTGPYHYSWTPAGSTSQNLDNIGAGTYSYTVTDTNGCASSNTIELAGPDSLSSPAVVSDYNGSSVTCNGSTNGFIHLTVSGGTGPYSYFWSPTGSTSQNLNNIGAGTYDYTVTDANGCTASDSITLTAPNPLGTIEATSSNHGFNISCHGGTNGSIDLTVNGGAGPYTYNWIPGNIATQDLSNIGAGLYIVTVTDANGCMAIDSTIMTEPGLLTVGGSVTDAQCNGVSNGSILTTTTGGAPAFSYLWSTGATTQNISGLGSGNYTVLVTDANGCIASNAFQVAQPNAIVSTINSPLLNGNYNISCNGAANGTASATAIGGAAPYTYLWSTGQTTQAIANLSPGAYSVTVIDANGCSALNTITLSQPPPIQINAGSSRDICGNSIVLAATNFGNGFTGTWSIQSGTASFSDVHDPHASVSGLSFGSNVLQLILTDGICSATASVSINAFDGVAAAAGTGDTLCPKAAKGYTLHAITPVLGSGQWSTSGTAGILTPASSQTEITGLTQGDNHFVWTVSNGPCVAADQVNVYLREQKDCYEELQMPTAYSPNNDGKNDDFDIHGIEKYPFNSLEVFNRWGNKVYFADNYENHQWKGQNLSGESLPDATYFVVLIIKNSDIQLHGYVDIRR